MNPSFIFTPTELAEIRAAIGFQICKLGQRRRWQERRELGGGETPSEKARNIYDKRGARIERLRTLLTRLESPENA